MSERTEEEVKPDEEEPNFGQVFKDAATFWNQKPQEQLG